MLLPILILLLLLILNGVFAMAELAMMTSRQSRLQQAAKAGSRGAAAAVALAREPTRFLSTVQVCITMIGILAGALGERQISEHLSPIVASVPALARYADTITLGIVVVLITYFSLVIGELVPKRIALAHPELIAATIARPLNALSLVVAWPVKLLTVSTELILKLLRIKAKDGDDISEDDVKSVIARAASTGIFTPQELKLFQRTMRAGDLVVRDLMVARTDIVWIGEDEPIEGVRVLIGTSPHSHFPICKAGEGGGLDQLIGVVHVKDLIAYGLLAGTDFKVTAVAQKPLFIPETMPALRLLDQFQSTKNHIAFVVDEYGATLGMLTFNDVTRAIVGDVSRKGQAKPASMSRRNQQEWFVDGRLPLHELVIGLELSPEVENELPDASTVAGLVTTVLGHIPREGESLSWQGYEIEVIDMDGTRIDKLLVRRTREAAAPSPQSPPAAS